MKVIKRSDRRGKNEKTTEIENRPHIGEKEMMRDPVPESQKNRRNGVILYLSI